MPSGPSPDAEPTTPPTSGPAGVLAFALAAAMFLAGTAAIDVGSVCALYPLPRVLPLVVGALLGIPMFAATIRRRERWMLWSCALVTATAVVFVSSPWHPRKRFALDLGSIRNGMTVDEVNAIMSGYEPRGDSSWSGPCPCGSNSGGPGDRMIGFAWTHTDGRYDADVGSITFENGRVVYVEFSPD